MRNMINRVIARHEAISDIKVGYMHVGECLLSLAMTQIFRFLPIAPLNHPHVIAWDEKA
jgi:hypothetical protein